MKRNALTILLILVLVIALATVLILVGLSHKPPKLPDSGLTFEDPIFPDTDDESDPPVTDPSTTASPDTDPDDPNPGAYEIPPAFRDHATLTGDTVVMTYGGYRVTFSTDYRLVDVGGVPSLIAPDGSSGKLSLSDGKRDVDALQQDSSFIPDIVRKVLDPVPGAELVSQSKMTVLSLYGTRVGVFTFKVKLVGTELDYRYFVFSDDTRFYTVVLCLMPETEYDFNDVMDSLEKVDGDGTTDPDLPKPPVTDPPVTNPPDTDPPSVILPPDDLDPPVTDPPVTDPPVTDPPVTDPPVTDGPSDEYYVPEAYRPYTTVNGDTVTLVFGGYRVSFPTSYTMLDLDGMPGLRAPDGSLATLVAEDSNGSVADLEEEGEDEEAVRARLSAAVAKKGGSEMGEVFGPIPVPFKGRDIAVYTTDYVKDGVSYELTHAIFYEDGKCYTVSQGMVEGSEYSFMDLMNSVEKVEE